MKRNIIYTCAFNENRDANAITQTHAIEVLKKYLKDIRYVKSHAEKGNIIKKSVKIIKDIFYLLTPFCSHRIFFYPTIPLYPARKSKEKIAMTVYKIMNRADRLLKIRHTVIIMDMPIEQAEDLKIHSVSAQLKRAVKKVEAILLGNADFIVDIGNFAKLCPPLSGKVIKTRFCPCLFGHEVLPREYKGNEVKVFYAGDMRREYEKDFILDLIGEVNFKEIKAEFHLCGHADDEFKKVCEAAENIKYYGFIQNSRCDELARESDFALMIYPPEGYYNYVSAAKFVTYIENYLPVLALDSQTIKENIDYFGIGTAVCKAQFLGELIKWIENKEFLKYNQNVLNFRKEIESGRIFECLSQIAQDMKNKF